MKTKTKNNGSVLLITVFAIALMATITAGILEMSTEELQLMQNQVNAARAQAVAEAGLNDAFARIRQDSSCISGFPFTESFDGGSYTVTAQGVLPDPNIISTGTSSQGFVARVEAEVTVGTGSPYIIRIDNLRINE
ncbi:MAG: hypothetical protein WC476_06790 [Phycisphaerae bacterium]|jgi:Tfp pilus assembly protein PilX